MILTSRAASPDTSLEAENGTSSGNITATADSSASNGNAVKFGSSGLEAECPPYPAMPDENCTGWQHTGVTLTLVKDAGQSGPGWDVENVAGVNILYIRQAGAVLDGLNIETDGCVKVLADNVTIKRSRIACSGYYLINTSDPPTYYTGLSVIDTELDGLGDTSNEDIAIMATADAHYQRLNIHGMASSGPRLASGDIFEDSYIHDFVCTTGLHSAGTSANDGGSNITVSHNNLDINTGAAGCASFAFELALDFGYYTDVTIQNNLFNGGAYCTQAGIIAPGNQYSGQSTGIKYLNNIFGRKYDPECGQYGPVSEWGSGSGNEWSGNTWGDGAAATSSHAVGDPVSP